MRTLVYLTTNGSEKSAFNNYDLVFNYAFSANNGAAVLQNLSCTATEKSTPTLPVPLTPSIVFNYQQGKEDLNVTQSGKEAVDGDLYDHIKAEFEDIINRYIPSN